MRGEQDSQTAVWCYVDLESRVRIGDAAFFGSDSGAVYGMNVATLALTLRTTPACMKPLEFITGRKMLVAVCEGKLIGFPLRP